MSIVDGNARGPAHRIIFEDRHAKMAAFDRLPARLRHRLAAARFDLSAIQAEEVYRIWGLEMTLVGLDAAEQQIAREAA